MSIQISSSKHQSKNILVGVNSPHNQSKYRDLSQLPRNLHEASRGKIKKKDILVGVDSPYAQGTEKWPTHRNGCEFPWDVDEGLRGSIKPEDVLVGVDSPHLRAQDTNSDCRKPPWNLPEPSL